MRNFVGSASTVTATEKWLQALQAGQCFARGNLLAASVGNLNQWQLKNPAASGKTVLVRSFFITPGANNSIVISFFDTDLTTDVGAGINLLEGAAAGVAHLRTQQTAALVGTELFELSVLATSPFVSPVEWFAQLGAGQGLVVQQNNANVLGQCGFLWLEQ